MLASRFHAASRLRLLSRFSLVVFVGWFVAPQFVSAEADPPVADAVTDFSGEVALLIDDLGANRFAVRQRATNRLTELGPVVLDAISAVLDDDDAEIRRRANHIFTSVNKTARQNLLQAFVSHPELSDDAESKLPGWMRLREAVGDNPDSRALLVAMLSDHWDAIESFELGEYSATDFIRQIKEQSRVRRSSLTVQCVSAAVLMAQNPQNESPTTEMTALLGLLRQVSSNRSAVQAHGADPWKQKVFRDLVSGLLKHCTEPTAAWQTFSLALQHNLDAAVEPALTVIENRECRAHVRQYALLTIAKFGTKDNVKRIKPLLDDTNVCYRREDPRTKKAQFECQVRDVAFATMLHLTSKDPRQFGFANAKANAYSVYQPSTLGFANDEERDVAYTKWENESGESLPRAPKKEQVEPPTPVEPAKKKTSEDDLDDLFG